ncbi:MAG: cytochrome P450 [Alphaproteobacteria bacterium]|nr:MAG: cytochrome P450 [Alphaproteobacteria bacterium]
MSDTPDFENVLLSDAFFTDPYPIYKRMREHAPVYWSPKLSSWLVTRYADCGTVLDDHETFSAAGRVAYLLDTLPDDMLEDVVPLRRHYAVGLAHSDPPAHTRLRRILRQGVNPKIARMRGGRIREIVDSLLAPLKETQEFDFIRQFAYPLPATVIAEMLGAPVVDIGRFKAWADDIAALFEQGGRMGPDAARKGLKSLREIRAYIGDMIARIRKEPGDDIMSMLVNAQSDEDVLSQEELIATAVTLFVAGHETTTNLLGLSLAALLRHPDQMRKLRDNPSLIANAVDEFLRFDSVIPRAWRIATRDTAIAGTCIKKGQMVMAMLGAANRDPDAFDDPDRLNVERKNIRHVGFGRGIHVCIGAPLARLEADIALQALLQSFPRLTLVADGIKWRRDIAIRGPKELRLSTAC